MTNGKVSFGLLGAGLIAPFHAKSILSSELCELAAIADMNTERAEKLGKEYGCKVYRTLEEMLAHPGLEVINVLTPNHLHADAVVAAAQAGKHALTEKPPAMSLAETDLMIRTCAEHKVQLGVVLQCRVRQPIQAMKKAIAQGRFGRLLQADADMKWFRTTQYYFSDPWRSSRKSGAGVTIQHAFHYIDLLHYLMGPVKSVQARMSNKMHPQVQLEDSLMAFIEYANGAQGVLNASTAFWPGTDIRVEVNGENGTATMVGEKMATWKFKDEGPEDEAIRQLGRGSVATAASGPADFDFADHKVVIEAMARAVRGQGEPAITVADARHSLEIALAMYQSAARNQTVQLPVVNEQEIWA